MMDCFNSTDRDAVNSTLLYDDNNDVDNLWVRNDTAAPLEPCFPLRPGQFPCTVCLHEGTVYAVCKKLPDGVRMVMEAVGKSIRISNCACPASPEDAQQVGIIVAPLLLLLLLLLIIIGVLLYRKCCVNTRKTQKDPDSGSDVSWGQLEPMKRTTLINDGSQQHPDIRQV